MYQVHIITTNNSLIKIPFKRYEYPNLMELIVNTYYEDIGECLGRGLCGTCHVKLVKGTYQNPKDHTETNTLNHLYFTDETSRLACQILLDETIDNLTFKLISDNNLNPSYHE